MSILVLNRGVEFNLLIVHLYNLQIIAGVRYCGTVSLQIFLIYKLLINMITFAIYLYHPPPAILFLN